LLVVCPFYKFFNIFDNPSEDLTTFPEEVVVFGFLGLEDPPFLFHISYSTLEAKKSAVCKTEINADFCLEDSTLLKKYASFALSNTPS